YDVDNTLRLEVRDLNGNLSPLASTSVKVRRDVPLASFTASPNPVRCAPPNNAVTFSSTSVHGFASRNQVTAWLWDFDGEATDHFVPGAAIESRAFPTFGSRSVKLRVRDNLGRESATFAANVDVSLGNDAPVAAFASPTFYATAISALDPLGESIL